MMVDAGAPPFDADLRLTLGENLRRLRAQRDWSQEDLAFECQLHRTFVAHVERGKRNISLDNIAKLAHALGVPAYRLLAPPTD